MIASHADYGVEVKSELTDFRQETRAGFRTVDERIAEITDLILGRRNGT